MTVALLGHEPAKTYSLPTLVIARAPEGVNPPSLAKLKNPGDDYPVEMWRIREGRQNPIGRGCIPLQNAGVKKDVGDKEGINPRGGVYGSKLT
jgi:hypothetical protein